MRAFLLVTGCAALLAGAALFTPAPALAASCCGGGSATGLIVPKFAKGVIDISTDLEIYDGYWNQKEKYTPDPPGSDLKQYRLNLGYGRRLAQKWQVGMILPYLWNQNDYSGVKTSSQGLGDASLFMWYDLLEEKPQWLAKGAEVLVPTITVGTALLLPTGISPYDSEESSFDITGRGFYRLDGNLLIDKTMKAWNSSLALAYGTYLERPINQEYGKAVEPYHKKPGNRTSASASLGYRYFIDAGGDTLTGTVGYAWFHEAEAEIDGTKDRNSPFSKQSISGTLSYSSTDSDWSVRGIWSHALREDGWGENFPVTDIYTLGVRYVFR
jgi:hypothetical protein